MSEQFLSENEWKERLKRAGLRATPGRLAAIQFVDQHPHSSATAVFEALESEVASISVQSAHNIVRDLSETGLLRKIDLPDSTGSLYETRVEDNHHHVQCVRCQKIEDIDCVVGEAPCLTPNHSHGIRLIEASVTFRGVCAECDEMSSAAAT